ncbi:MAG: hypothetical protein AAB075_06725 [Gemmatimonadota bacterium]
MRALLLCACVTGSTSHLLAQDWNGPDAMAVVERAVARRTAAQGDPDLRQMVSRARGTVLLLSRIGSDPLSPPRLLKTDQLEVEVYWRAPNQSKQIILGWRERTDFPTNVRYHRDHLGIIPDAFGPLIRLGEGDEIRDLIHPLSPAGLAVYDYAAGDSLVVEGGGARVRVRVVQVRPRNGDQPGVVGALYLDMATGALVRFRFTFTAAAYRQPGLETIAVDLESAWFDQRYWLPFRQRLEITRGTSWLDLPVTTVIRTEWEIGDYEFGAAIPDGTFLGGPYGGLRSAVQGGLWDEPLDRVIARAREGAQRVELGAIEREVASWLNRADLRPRPPAQPALGSLSDLVLVNRVQGLALGVGLVLRPLSALVLRPRIQVATVDGAVQGGVGAELGSVGGQLVLRTDRTVRDLSDWPIISRTLNSVLAQEGGADHGDYVRIDRAEATWLSGLGSRGSWRVGLGVESSTSLKSTASPASGSYRPNPALGAGGIATLRTGLAGSVGTAGRGAWIEIDLEGGLGGRDYGQGRGRIQGVLPAPGGRFELRGQAGGTVGTPPPHRLFTLGGRGTLPGEPFRAWGGTALLLGRVDWVLGARVPFPRLGSYPALKDPVTLGPFAALGWAGGQSPVDAWRTDGGVRPVIGVAAELFFGLVRIEAGWALRSGRIGIVVDAAPGWWPIL